jgi:molybdopterin-containing oxidoreductase family iron-sulfur binding subunit
MAWARQGESIDRPPAQRKQKERECEDAPRRAERRGLLKKILGGAAAVACATFALEGEARASTSDAGGDMARPLDAPKGLLEGNILERMRHDLLRALKKPVSERKWVMIIDQQKCIGC